MPKNWRRSLRKRSSRPGRNQGRFSCDVSANSGLSSSKTRKGPGTTRAFSVEFARKIGTKAFICCPIVCADDALGVLAVGNVTIKRPLLQGDIDLLTQISGQIGVSIRNVTARLAEKAVRESEARFRAVVEKSGEVIVLTDARGKLHVRLPAGCRGLRLLPRRILRAAPAPACPSRRSRTCGRIGGLAAAEPWGRRRRSWCASGTKTAAGAGSRSPAATCWRSRACAPSSPTCATSPTGRLPRRRSGNRKTSSSTWSRNRRWASIWSRTWFSGTSMRNAPRSMAATWVRWWIA